MNAKIIYEKISESVQIAKFPHIKQVKVEPYKKNYILRVTQNNNKYVIFKLNEDTVLADLCQNNTDWLERTIIKIKEFVRTEYQETKICEVIYNQDSTDVLIKELEKTNHISGCMAVLFLILSISANAGYATNDTSFMPTMLYLNSLSSNGIKAAYYDGNVYFITGDINTISDTTVFYTDPFLTTVAEVDGKDNYSIQNITTTGGYSVEQISDTSYANAQTQSNAPIFQKMTSNGTESYVWTIPDLTVYKTSSDLDVFNMVDSGNGGINYYIVDTDGNVTSNTYYYTGVTENHIYDYVSGNVIGQTPPPVGYTPIQTDVINAYFLNTYSISGNPAGHNFMFNGTFINNSDNHAELSGNVVRHSDGLQPLSLLSGIFLGNSGEGVGGAIYNDKGQINNIIGDFVINGARSGGAIYNSGIIDNIIGDFIGNLTIEDLYNNDGGAIFNVGMSTNTGLINSISGNFIGNHSAENGGAIYNYNGNININSYSTELLFSENFAQKGGAIYNYVPYNNPINGVLNISANGANLQFLHNSAESGGAIYNNGGTININVMDGNILFSENTNGAIVNTRYNMYAPTHILNINATGGDVIFNNNPDGAIIDLLSGEINLYSSDNHKISFLTDSDDVVLDGTSVNIGLNTHVDMVDILGTGTINNNGALTVAGNVSPTVLINNDGGLVDILANYVSNVNSYNYGMLTLTGGTLNSKPNQNWYIIGGAVTNNVSLAGDSISINIYGSLETSATNISGTNMVNVGILTLTGGTVGNFILNNGISPNHAGDIVITGNVVSNDSNLRANNITINENNSLTISANNITANNIINNGILYLAGFIGSTAEANNYITGTGTIITTANLSGNADVLGNDINNDYNFTLSGGTLSNDISGDGNLVINGDVTVVDGVSIANDININQEKQLSISASSIGSNVINSGTLSLTGGTLNHQITGNGVINITDYTYTSANNLLGTGNISNTSTLELTGGTLQQVISGNGNIVINGDVFSSASNLQNNTIISDENTLTLTGGILQKTISASGNGNIVINGDVSTQADNLLASTSLNDGTVLTLNGGTLSTQLTGTGTLAINNNYSVSSSANNIGVDVNNNGYLTLSGGTLSNDIIGSGQTIINGTVTNNAIISQTMVVNSGKSLTTAASGIGANILNNGNVTVTGGTVNYNITGDGTVTIDGNVENNGNLGLVAINENKSLTTSADSIYGISSNNGNLYLNGGTLGYGVSGNVYITGDVTNTVNQAHSINISNGGTFTTAANLLTNNNAISNDGTLNITGGNLQQNVTGGNTIIAQNATTSATSFGNLELNGIMNVGTNTVNMANADINGTINLGISSLNKNSSTYTGGHIIANDITFGDNAVLNLTITDTNLQKGDSTGDLSIITANGEWTGDIATFTSNNLYDIAYNTENHTFTFTRKKFGADLITELNGTELDVNVATVWDELQSSDNPNIQNIINAIDYNSQHNATKYAKLIHNLAPQNHQVTVGAVRNTNTVIDNHIFTRLATLRRPQINRTNANPRKRRANPFYYYGNYRGRNGGDTEPTTNNGMWVEGLYNYAQQKDDTKFSGKTFGIMGGFDSKLTEHLTAGLGYAFNKTNIDADNHDIDAMGHTGFIYAEYKPTQWYLDALLSYNLTNYQNSAALIDNLTVKSDYKTNSLSGALTSGYDFQKGLDLYGGLNYIGIKQDAYTDTAGQYVKADDTQMLTLKAGGRYKLTSQKMKRASTVLKAAVLYDVMSDDGVTTVTVGNNNYIVHGNGIDPFGVQAGIMFDSFGGNTYLSIGYDLEWRNNFISHTGYIKLKYNF